MEEENRARVGYVDSKRQELLAKLTEVRAHQDKLMREASMLRADIERLLEVNTQQIAITDHFIEEVGDDAEARHYLTTFKSSLVMTRVSIEALREEMRR